MMDSLTISITIDPGAFSPEKAHEDDAGLDIKAMYGMKIPAGKSATFDTGIHMSIPSGFYGKIESRSGLNVKHGIVSCGGIIDSGYTGTIVVKLYNLSDVDYEVNIGDKIAQLIIMQYQETRLRLNVITSEEKRGSNGFGSSGR